MPILATRTPLLLVECTYYILAPFTWETESGLRVFGDYGNPAAGRPSLLVAQWTEMEAAEQQS